MTFKMKLDERFEEGRLEGIEQGIEQGIERGIEQGQKEAHRKDAIRLHQKGKDVAFIADMLDESVQQVEEWLGLVLA